MVQEYGSEGRASWPFADGIFVFGEKKMICQKNNFSWRKVFRHKLCPEDVSDLGWECLDSLGKAEFSPTEIVHSG